MKRKRKPPHPEIVDVDAKQLAAIAERAEAGQALSREECRIMRSAFDSLSYLTNLLTQKNISIERLRKLLFGASTETTKSVLGEDAEGPSSSPAADALEEPAAEGDPPDAPPKQRKGHGRNGADAYHGAERIPVPHESLQSGDNCPECQPGALYEMSQPAKLIRIVGQAPLHATVYERQRLRCNLCGRVFNDDTNNRILELMGQRLAKARAEKGSAQMEKGSVTAESGKEEDDPERRGIFTSGIVSACAGHRIALFFTGRKHAGENLREVLARRADLLGPPIQMCDALSRNMPAELKTILANCLAHGRRKFVDVAEHFHNQCRYVLNALKLVYKHDADARQQNLSPEARLQFHQAKSAPVMETLHAWLTRQIEDRLVEPNSGLGEAIAYMLKHWPKLTLFLHRAGAPLDNNVCERALKKAILHRKNALFYKTEKGAQAGDMYMSLIYTCELCGANPFDYLTQLQRHTPELSANPECWMPWNYRQTLDDLPVTVPPEIAR